MHHHPPSILRSSRLALCLALTAIPVLTGTSRAVTYIAPQPYLSFNGVAAGSAISPFSLVPFYYFHLEDFEDGSLNTPGVSISEFSDVGLETTYSDSVDGDDGVIDGYATGISTSLFSAFATSSFTFTFSAGILGTLPTHAGIVWTDIGRNFGGTPLSGDLVNNVTFEAFGPTGASLGIIGPFSLGDTGISRTTAEDRFIGVINDGGISAFRISMPGLNNWEVDHLQYGSTVPEPIAPALLLSASGLLLRRRRSLTTMD
jgi:hypothetical protein